MRCFVSFFLFFCLVGFCFGGFLGIHVCISVCEMMEWFCNFLPQLQFPEVVRGGGKANGFNF